MSPVALMSAEEVAAASGFSLQRVWYLARTGGLPVVRVGRRTFFRRDEIADLLGSSSVRQKSVGRNPGFASCRRTPDGPGLLDVVADILALPPEDRAALARPNLGSRVSSILALAPEDRAALLRLLQSEPHPAG